MRSYKCDNCGAEILINDSNTFSRCIYCGSTVTLNKKEYKDLNIKKVIPFRTTEEEAINYLTFQRRLATRDSIIDVKRIFVPVRFCSYDFNYLCLYEYEISSDDDSTTYEDRNGLVDGLVYKEAILETTIMNSILGFHDLRGNAREDFDPVKLGNISCEFSNSYDDNKLRSLIEERLLKFGKSLFTGPKYHKIYNVNHYLSNVDIENFTTLVPVYLIKTNRGNNYAVSGALNSSVEETNNSLRPMSIVGIVLFIVGFVFFPLCFIGIVLLIVDKLSSPPTRVKTQTGYELSDNIKFTIHTERSSDKKFIFHDFK